MNLPICTVVAALVAATPWEVGAVATQVSARAGEVRDIQLVSGTGGSAVLLAATQGGGLFRSTDSGQNWSWLSTFPGRYVWKVAVSPGSSNRIYAASESGLYRTTDGGTSWAQLTTDTTRAVAIDPSSGATDTLLVGVSGSGILKSTDNGTSLTRVSGGLDSSNVLHIAYSTSSLAYAALACNVEDGSQAGNWGGVFESTNGGTSWANINSRGGATLPTKCVTSLAVGGTTVIVGTIPPGNPGAGKIHRTTTAGAAWSIPTDNDPGVGSIFGVEHVSVDRGSSTTFWGGAREVGVWKSTNSGVNWTQQVNSGTDPDVFSGIYSIGTIPSSTAVLAGVKGLGLMRSPDGNSPWTSPAGLSADRVRSLSNSGATYYMALEQGGVMRSNDAGATWAQLNNGLQVGQDFIRNPQVIAVNPANPNVVNIGMYANGLYTFNAGTSTWTTSGVTAGLNGGVVHVPQSMAFSLGGDKFLYSLFEAGSVGGLFQGTNAGTLSSAGVPIFDSNPGLGIAPGGYRIIVSPADGNRLYYLVFDSAAYRTTNGGTNWSRVNVTHTGFLRIGFYDIADKPGSSTSVATTNKGIFRSTNGGADWARVNATGLTQMTLSSIAYSSNGRVWGGDLGGGFWCSTDDGSSWQAVNRGSLPAAAIREVRFLNGLVHALTDGAGIYKNDPAICP